MYSVVYKTSEKWKNKSGEINKLNTDYLFETDNEYGFPVVSSSPGFVASDLLPFHLAKGQYKDDLDKAVHFFIDDYKFEQIWSTPFKYIPMFRNYGNIISPDFSVWSVQPYALNLFNMYRSRWCTRFYQEMGVNVLVDVRWADKSTWDFCFSGIEKHTPVIINTVGTKLLMNRQMFVDGFFAMLKRIEPSDLYVYGEYMPIDFEGYFDTVTYFDSFWKKQRDKISEKEEMEAFLS